MTVWAVDDAVVRELLERLGESDRSSVTQLPRAVAEAGQSARTMSGSTVQFVADLERQSVGPPGQESAVAYQPILEQMRNGIDVAIAATPGDDGKLIVGVNLDEATIEQVHTGSFEDEINGPSEPADRPVLGLFRRRGEGSDPDVARASGSKLQASFQVPEISRSHLEGSWPVRSGETLVISLGARSTREKWGKESVGERVVTITVQPEAARGSTFSSGGLNGVTPPPPVPVSGGAPPCQRRPCRAEPSRAGGGR